MHWFLFFYIASITIGPFVPFTHVPFAGNLAVGDIGLCFLVILLMVRRNVCFPSVAIVPCLLGIVSLASMLFSMGDVQDELPWGYTIRWFYFSSLIIVIANFVKNEKIAKYCLLGFVFGAFLTTVWAWYAWSLSPRYFGGFPMLHLRHQGIVFEINRNYFGFFASIGASVTYGLIRDGLREVRFIYRFMFGALFVFFLVSTALTFSKGAWVTAFGSIMIFELWSLGTVFKSSKLARRSARTLGFASFVFVFVCIVGNDTLIDYVSQARHAIDLSGETNSQRLDYVEDAVLLTISNPMLGVGPKNYKNAAGRAGLWETTDPHNAILWISAELGAVAGLLVLGLFAMLFWKSVSKKWAVRYGNVSSCIQLTGISIFLNIPIHGLPVSMKYTWVLLGIVAGLTYWSRWRDCNIVRQPLS